METPASRYTPSPRSFPAYIPPPEYDQDCTVRKVLGGGRIRYHGRQLFVSEALVGQTVGLRPISESELDLRFYTHSICIINLKQVKKYETVHHVPEHA